MGLGLPLKAARVAADVVPEVFFVSAIVFPPPYVVDALSCSEPLQNLGVILRDFLHRSNANVAVEEVCEGFLEMQRGLRGECLRSICSIFLSKRRLCC